MVRVRRWITGKYLYESLHVCVCVWLRGSCYFSRKTTTFGLAGMGRSQLSVAMWGNGTKINCVCVQLTQSIRSSCGRPSAARDQWSMLYFAGSFSIEPFNNPVGLWESISHTTAGAVNSCLIKLETHLWFVISLIEATYGQGKAAWLRLSWQVLSACWSQQRSTPNNFSPDDLFLLMSLKEGSPLIICKGGKRAVWKTQVKYHQSAKETLNKEKVSGIIAVTYCDPSFITYDDAVVIWPGFWRIYQSWWSRKHHSLMSFFCFVVIFLKVAVLATCGGKVRVPSWSSCCC